jgi:hypothetical protein
MLTKTYAGIGSRETPSDILEIMFGAAQLLATNGYTLRSGYADGADKAFEEGCDSVKGPKEIYLPWTGFNRSSPDTDGHYVMGRKLTALAEIEASKYHPKWDELSRGVRLLMARNAYQILGPDLHTPTQFVICWTPNGSGKGGTGQSIRMADALKIPVVDLGHPMGMDHLNELGKSL